MHVDTVVLCWQEFKCWRLNQAPPLNPRFMVQRVSGVTPCRLTFPPPPTVALSTPKPNSCACTGFLALCLLSPVPQSYYLPTPSPFRTPEPGRIPSQSRGSEQPNIAPRHDIVAHDLTVSMDLDIEMDDAAQEPLMEEPSRSNADDILVRPLWLAHTHSAVSLY